MLLRLQNSRNEKTRPRSRYWLRPRQPLAHFILYRSCMSCEVEPRAPELVVRWDPADMVFWCSIQDLARFEGWLALRGYRLETGDPVRW